MHTDPLQEFETMAHKRVLDSFHALAPKAIVTNSVVDAMVRKEVQKAIQEVLPPLLDGTINEMVLARIADLEDMMKDVLEAIQDLENLAEELEWRSERTEEK